MISQLVTEILKDAIGLGFIILTPYAIKALTAAEQKAKAIIGATNFNYAKDYIQGQFLLHPDLFTEENIVNFLDHLDNKFGDRLTRDTITRIVKSDRSHVVL